MSTALFSNTPTVTVKDSHGRIVREIVYHRHPDTPQACDERITLHCYSARGALMQSVDPRLHESGLANFRYMTALAGARLQTQSVDAGTTLALSDTEGRALATVTRIELDPMGRASHAEAVIRAVEYEHVDLPGRPLAITEQVFGAGQRVVERLVYAGNDESSKSLNLAGQCVSHYDAAGLMQTDSIALTAATLSTTRRLLKDVDDRDSAADWQGEEVGQWQQCLAEDLYTSVTRTDAMGVTLTTTDAAGHRQRFAHDVAGMRLASWLTLKGRAEQVITSAVDYCAAGNRLREVHANGVTTLYTYDQRTQRLDGIRVERTGARLLRHQHYAYDPVGNVLKVRNDAPETRFWRNQKIVAENAYTYDSLYQLTCAKGREMASAGQPLWAGAAIDASTYRNYARSYRYDRGGNLTHIVHTPSTGSSQTIALTVSGRSNRAVLATLTDAPTEVDGLFTAGGEQKVLYPGQTLDWTARNELRQVTLVARGDNAHDSEHYRYDSANQRIVKISRRQASGSLQTRRTIYVPGLELQTTLVGETQTRNLQVVAIGEAGSTQVRVMHWQHGKPDELENDQLRFSHDDLIGSSGLELDARGQVISQEEYYPYGGTAILSARSEVEASYKALRYSGKERDATGLYYYGYRYYQPWAGRWLSPDPAGTVDGQNLYRMVRNNPVTYRDTDGRVAVEGPPTSAHAGHLASSANARGPATQSSHLTDIFKTGDIVYGLDAPRKKALLALDAAGHRKVAPVAGVKKLTKLFGKATGKANIRIQNDITNAVWNPSAPTAYASDGEIKKSLLDSKRAIAFKNFLENHSKYNVKDQQEALGIKENPARALELATVLWARTSKAGLEFQLVERNMPLHFLADTIADNVDVVVSKTGFGASITSSELRWLYRHRDMEQVKQNLHFYRDGKAISQDEVFAKPEWRRYEPKSQHGLARQSRR
ncbi:RHS repeat-associated core domain-containing protein [Pseudomonas sp. microsymbiont 2]